MPKTCQNQHRCAAIIQWKLDYDHILLIYYKCVLLYEPKISNILWIKVLKLSIYSKTKYKCLQGSLTFQPKNSKE